MKNGILRLTFLLAAVLAASPLIAQTASNGSSVFSTVLTFVVAILALGVVAMVGDNLLSIEAQRVGVDNEDDGFFASLFNIFKPKAPAHLEGKRVKVFTKGFDLDLIGEADKKIANANVNTFALQPDDYRGIAPIPKVEVEVGATVKAGDAIAFDKSNPDVKYVAPVSGEFIALNRGAKRKITELVFLADKEQQYKKFEIPNLDTASREEIKSFLFGSGAWTLLRQRPFDVVADPNTTPANICISTFDSSPLAADFNLAVAGRGDDLNAGIEVLSKLTNGQVYLGLNGSDENIASEFVNAEGCVKTYFVGQHPAGNVGIQMHHTAPIHAGESVFTIGLQDLLVLGNLFLEGVWDTTRLVAITGSEATNRTHLRTKAGANMGELLANSGVNEGARIISGNVLTGSTKTNEQFFGTWENQVTALEEGDYYEMFGWILPQKGRPSLSGTFPAFEGVKYTVDTNTHGEKRAFVMTGQYEQVLPMDIYPQHLMKAILANDFERMEGLGIYELIEEDVAICEYVCTSKQPLQKILRDGLDYVKEQG